MMFSVKYWGRIAMVNTYNFILILIVYTAILLLVIFYVYPFLKKLFSHKISISIHIGTEKKENSDKVVQPKKQEEMPSVLGKSKFVLSQPLPNTTTNFETENRRKKENTFAPETEKSEDENVNYETGEGIEIPSENDELPDVDLNEEYVGVGGEPHEEASGIDYNELQVTAKTIENPKASSSSDEILAGKVLSENKCTQLVQSIKEARPEYARRITELLDMHERKLAEEQAGKTVVSKQKQKLYESEDFKNFSVDEIS